MNDKIIELLQELLRQDNIQSEDIPNIELYMDQVTTFMDTHLASSKRYPEDKIMTKTMINNYTKNHLLPPSYKKKYSREHIFLLIMIYYYKNVLSISDIQKLVSPLSEAYFPVHEQNGLSMETIYTTVIEQMEESKQKTEQEILDTLSDSSRLFEDSDLTTEDRDTLTLYSMISQLCYDITLRKQLIEKLIDQLYPDPASSQKKNTKPDKKNKK